MRTSTITLALLVSLAPGVFINPVYAQTGSEDPTTAMARARFKEGVDFYDKGEYEQARASFLQAYALKKHPAVLLNLAWSCLKSGHTLDANKYFQQFLTEGKDITDKQRADANDGLSQARAKLGRIEVQAAAGAEVTVDGEKVGTTPLADAVAVEAGAHTVKFKGADGTTDTESVSVLGGQKAVAKFGGSGANAPTPTPVPAPTSSPAPSDTTAPPAPSSTSDQTKPPEPPPKESGGGSHGSIFDRPKNLVPAVAMGAIGIVGFGVSVAFLFIKQGAQNNANSVAAQIAAHGGAPNFPSCPNFPSACSAYQSDLNDVNTDATVANVGIIVGIAGVAGAVVYWLVADKDTGGSASTKPVLVPTVGRNSGGFALSGQF
jgi:hypothetical protein